MYCSDCKRSTVLCPKVVYGWIVREKIILALSSNDADEKRRNTYLAQPLICYWEKKQVESACVMKVNYRLFSVFEWIAEYIEMMLFFQIMTMKKARKTAPFTDFNTVFDSSHWRLINAGWIPTDSVCFLDTAAVEWEFHSSASWTSWVTTERRNHSLKLYLQIFMDIQKHTEFKSICDARSMDLLHRIRVWRSTLLRTRTASSRSSHRSKRRTCVPVEQWFSLSSPMVPKLSFASRFDQRSPGTSSFLQERNTRSVGLFDGGKKESTDLPTGRCFCRVLFEHQYHIS